MLETYLDESDNSHHKLFSVGALVIEQEARETISQRLDSICGTVAARLENPSLTTAELHGINVFGGEKEWDLVPPRLRINTYGKVLEVLRDHAIRFIIKPIRYETLWRDPHHLAMVWALERVQDIAADRQTESLLFADRKPEAEHGLQLAFRAAQLNDTRGWRPTRLTRIKDKVNFVDSSTDRLIQACDMALFIHHRRIFDQLAYADKMEVLSPGKRKSIEAVRKLDSIIWPIRSALATWP